MPLSDLAVVLDKRLEIRCFRLELLEIALLSLHHFKIGVRFIKTGQRLFQREVALIFLAFLNRVQSCFLD